MAHMSLNWKHFLSTLPPSPPQKKTYDSNATYNSSIQWTLDERWTIELGRWRLTVAPYVRIVPTLLQLFNNSPNDNPPPPSLPLSLPLCTKDAEMWRCHLSPPLPYIFAAYIGRWKGEICLDKSQCEAPNDMFLVENVNHTY